ncbi:2-octaprenyl-6-methoxyphenyl hydroxylase [Motiliproteus sp. MSK22-1]|uniref:2-octaprenyl-6-methoxyphenyl hydroxylase n=1 Tax=Motiliproteus sp. MSK22-1 TaxID=1897630 RepID=UPI000977A5A2|nr:2-octaprenyl-6-methoxyphenyl hydroxylase [Motiliproteus sp. MSK22-1]
MKSHYDIAIIGGGMVGASLAVSLLQAASKYSLSIAVFEAHPLPEPTAETFQPSYDARSTALSFGTRKLLEQMGVWDTLRAQVSPIEKIRVSDRGHFGAVRLEAKTQQVPALGYVVENRWLGQTLLDALSRGLSSDSMAKKSSDAVAESPVSLLCPTEVISAEPLDKGMQLVVRKDGSTFDVTADLVVMADGGRSALREKLAIDYNESDYQQYAVVANITPDRPHQNIAYERFTASGPMALLPLTNDGMNKPRCALVWSIAAEQAEQIMNCSGDKFLHQLQQQFGYRAGIFQQVGQRYCYPLQLMRVREQVRQGIVVLGNAAHTLHPIAGQGFNLALRGALALSEQLVKAVEEGADLGAMATLRQFEQRLEWDQDKTIGFSDQVTRLFSSEAGGAVVARNLGLLAMDLSPIAKQWFARSAMGLDIPAPAFANQARE